MEPAEAPLSACKWIFCVLHFCEDCLLAALTVSAVPAVIDEPGGTLHPPVDEREKERKRDTEGEREKERGGERELLLHHFSWPYMADYAAADPCLPLL